MLLGLLFGILLLLLTSQALNFIDIASSLVYALTIPFAAIALTLYYFDLETQSSRAADRTPARREPAPLPDLS